MSANKKKSASAMEHDNSETDSSSEDEYDIHPDAYTGNEEVQVDFEGRAPIDPDCHDLIIAQNFVGSVICQCETDGADSEGDDNMCEDGTIFGITTVLNMTAKKDTPCIEQLRSYIIEHAEKYATDSELTHFRDVLGNDARPVGFLINERFINIPAQISVPLLENLHKEIQIATQKGMKFNIVYFLMIVKVFRKEAHKGKPAENFYTNAEEEVICNQAVNTFEFSVADECDMGVSGDWLEGDASLTPYRKVILFDAKQLPHLIKDIKEFIDGQ